MTDLERIKTLLRDMNLAAVARGSGVSWTTVKRASCGMDVSMDTIRRLEGYFDGRDSE